MAAQILSPEDFSTSDPLEKRLGVPLKDGTGRFMLLDEEDSAAIKAEFDSVEVTLTLTMTEVSDLLDALHEQTHRVTLPVLERLVETGVKLNEATGTIAYPIIQRYIDKNMESAS